MVKIMYNNNRHDFPGYMSVYIMIGAVANQQKMWILGDISTHQHQDNGKNSNFSRSTVQLQTHPKRIRNFK